MAVFTIELTALCLYLPWLFIFLIYKTLMKKISILGSTGSIGIQTLQIVAAFPEKFTVIGLAAGQNIDLFKQQVLAFKPKLISVRDPLHQLEMTAFIKEHHLKIEVMSGQEGLVAVATLEGTQLAVIAVVGTASLLPTVKAIEKGIPIGLACKEILVSAGDLIMSAARKHQVPILPIDSEHAALKQCLAGIHENPKYIYKLILTASGGPFKDFPQEKLNAITKEQALKHPKWVMGPKVTIDSSTLMNKGLEVIEAHHLFNVPYETIDVAIHPQSIVHSAVEFTDGTLLAQMGMPDMRFPIQYVLTYPEKCSNPWPKMDLKMLGRLDFSPPDHNRFPLLNFAFLCGKHKGTWPVVMNAANEAAVHLFLHDKLAYADIAKTVMKTTEAFSHQTHPTLDDIIRIDKTVKNKLIKNI
jgi:1-deoxy-D-xylulose-5-phosphate reductoisomerase